MHRIRHKTLFLAAFVFAAGFAGTAAATSCWDCQQIYDACMREGSSSQSHCAHLYNQCAQPILCPLMPETEIE